MITSTYTILCNLSELCFLKIYSFHLLLYDEKFWKRCDDAVGSVLGVNYCVVEEIMFYVICIFLYRNAYFLSNYLFKSLYDKS